MLSPRYWTFLLIVFAAIVFSMYQRLDQPELIVSPSDPYQYRYLELDNGLKTLLVSTPDADKAAAAVSVSVGSGDDPEGREGLAHFLEHMLFLGTEPYPEAGDYQAYISRNGGSHNAFTANSQTTYFFEVNNTAMEGALDRFAPFFISPTFDAQYVEREKNAVHAEYKSKYKDDFRRIFSAEKQAMNPAHPFASFSTGNLDTLADRDGSNIRDELLDFYAKHYSSDKMTLVLAGNYSLEQLEQWAVSHFNAVPQQQTTKQPQPVPLFTEGQLPLDLNIEPVKEIRRLQFTFPLPASKHLYAYKPIQVISSLIGHEGEGSLLAFLKQRGWAEGLSAGRSMASDHETTMVVQVSLTQKGLLYTDQITLALMHYIDLMKQAPLPEYISQEQANLSELAFRFQEQSRLSDYVVRLSSNLLVYQPHDVIYGDYKWQPISQPTIKPFLDALTADNMLRTLIAPNVTTEIVDPWYGTNIRLRPSTFPSLELTTSGLDTMHLPQANPFIPENLELQADVVTEKPLALINEAERAVWYYAEPDFKQPKSHVRVLLQQPDIQNSARQRVLARLYTRTVNEALNTYSYPAAIAGLSYNLSVSGQGLLLHIGGYQDKLPELLQRVLTEMQQAQLNDDEFIRYKNSLQRALENQLKGKPYQRSLEELKHWLYQPAFSPQQLLAELENVTRADVESFAAGFSDKMAHQLYLHGHLSQAQARDMADKVQAAFPANHALLTPAKVRKAPAGQHQQPVQVDHQDTAFTLYVQGADTSDRSRAAMSLMGQVLSAPYYQYMRTEQQLGYIVFATPYPQQTVPALAFIVQSPEASPEKIFAHSQTFFKQFAETLTTMSQEEFVNFQNGLINLLLEKPKNMAEKASRFWRDLGDQRYSFDSMPAIAEQVKQLTLEDIQALYQSAIIDQQQPWLLFVNGGELEDIKPLSEVDREAAALFNLGTSE
ncbi:insulinase family protein [Bacterioplanoides sp. SCSIO 12839]|uniref:insulinase family protein n=1 Tax=Bacterioplanoides sp. SCSIO 12839 TaxID=2829569 RepID=UPI002103172E|nr:insulinase family protein [Bacterioplanoides sp. SCSIO 12839]UTW47332.1 insulinase family protein [Bacterioplanoides sp. SCSIO 12839]